MKELVLQLKIEPEFKFRYEEVRVSRSLERETLLFLGGSVFAQEEVSLHVRTCCIAIRLTILLKLKTSGTPRKFGLSCRVKVPVG